MEECERTRAKEEWGLLESRWKAERGEEGGNVTRALSLSPGKIKNTFHTVINVVDSSESLNDLRPRST